VRPGDVLTFAQGAQVRVIEIAAIGARRGPAPEAQALYRDRAPEDWPRDATGALAMSNAPLDVDGLISQGARANSLPALTRS